MPEASRGYNDGSCGRLHMLSAMRAKDNFWGAECHGLPWSMMGYGYGHPLRPTNESWYTNHSTFLWMTIPEVLPFIFHGIPLRPDFRPPDGPSPKLQTSATLSPWILETRWYVEVYNIYLKSQWRSISVHVYESLSWTSMFDDPPKRAGLTSSFLTSSSSFPCFLRSLPGHGLFRASEGT